MKLVFKISIALIILILISGILGLSFFINSIGPVSKDSTDIPFEVPTNSTYSSLAESLKTLDLIKSKVTYKIYLKIYKPTILKAGTYKLNKAMGIKKIIEVLSEGNSYNTNVVNITFREGLNMRGIADVIEKNTTHKKEEVLNLLKDTNYLNELIDKYWFLTDEIKDSKIYYPLEGYLFPDTYQFKKEASVKDIFKVMLDQMDKELAKYKTEISQSKYSVHQLLTLASIIELEAGTSHERNAVAGVFYNRLNDGWSLGSDVTTYYATKKSFKEELTYVDLQDCNSYNTRSSCLVGLPIGPISNPSIESIVGSILPTTHNYYYFVADKTGKTYFNIDSAGHTQTIRNLKSAGLWYEYN